MDVNLTSLPLKYAKLIIAYTHNKLSEPEQDELDQWLEASDENLEIFEALTEGMDDNVLSVDDLIIETDDVLDIWMIAGLIARQMQGIVTSDEQRTLDTWIDACERNKALYHTLTNKANLQKFIAWFRQTARQDASPTGLN